ncbi:hypothetical protein [Arthrobacter sp. TMS1-12-1]
MVEHDGAARVTAMSAGYVVDGPGRGLSHGKAHGRFGTSPRRPRY